jgi:hypothetical protein
MLLLFLLFDCGVFATGTRVQIISASNKVVLSWSLKAHKPAIKEIIIHSSV